MLDRAGGPTQVTFWHAMSAQNQVALQALVGSYNAMQDLVRVNLVFQGNYGDTGSGDGPDLVQLDTMATQLMIDSRGLRGNRAKVARNSATNNC